MARSILYVAGVVIALIGLWGLFATPVLGIFDLYSAQAVLYLLAGLSMLAAAGWAPQSSAMVLKVLGILYAIAALLGFVIPGDILGFMENTTADNVFHLVIAVVLLWGGFMKKSSASERMMNSNGGN